MKRQPVLFGFLLLILLLVAGKFSVTAEERLIAVRVSQDFSGDFSLERWAKNTAVYDYNFSGNLSLRLYTGFNEKLLFLGFSVQDASLTFGDDFTLDYRGSDHLRIYFSEDVETKSPITLYLLPNSKINEPLLNITGAAWRYTSIAIHSSPGPAGYFLAIAIDRSNLRSTWQREIPLQIGIHNVDSQGKANIYWLFGSGPQDRARLVLAE